MSLLGSKTKLNSFLFTKKIAKQKLSDHHWIDFLFRSLQTLRIKSPLGLKVIETHF